MRVLLYLIALLFSTVSYSQEISARLLNEEGKAIAFATIQTAENSGVISNSEGYFSLSESQLKDGSIKISCMGYQSKTISIDELKQSNSIVLQEFVNELGSVYISNNKPDIDSIMARVRRNIAINYNNNELSEFELFYRGTSYISFGELNFTLEKATGLKKKNLEGANKSLDSLTRIIKESKAVHFKDYFADFKYKNPKEYKIEVAKATQLLDSKKNISTDQIQEKAQYLLLKHLDTTKTFKVKTGLFKVEDSLSFEEAISTAEKNIEQYNVGGLKRETYETLNNSHFTEGSILMNLLDDKLYEYHYRDVTFFNDQLIYIVDFTPRRSKAKLGGSFFITEDSYALIRADYAYADGKRGKKFNLKLLFGIKYIENHRTGTILFEKAEDGFYYPHYITEEDGNYFFLNRPLKFIENSRAKNKLSMEFTIEGEAKERSELLIVANKRLDETSYNAYKEPEHVPYIKLNQYDPSIWKEYISIEPLEEMKSFKSGEDL